MRANYASDHQAPGPTRRDGDRRGGGWLPNPRVIAAGGAVLAQVWTLGIGVTSSYAASIGPTGGAVSRAVSRAAEQGPAGTEVGGTGAGGGGQHSDQADHRTGAQISGRSTAPVGDPMATDRSTGQGTERTPGQTESPGLVGNLTGAVPALKGSTAPVNQVLQERIRAGGLPLPGQATAVPDAFSIASVLLPAVPTQPHTSDPRSPRDAVPSPEQKAAPASTSAPGAGSGTGTRTEAGAVPSAVGADAPTDGSPLNSPPPAPGSSTAAPGTARPATGGAERRLQSAEQILEDDLALTALAAAATTTVSAPPDTTGTATAVLAPIAAGMLLTAAAMYKHRGLPKGH
ncbi:hypothetical protein [Kitasatospora sp. NPDC050543]|uniref:hypothetical protein n=1 Tax=Kitasatospora sp. NPDC050543 TaxID=3364054 RepID=UPI0037B1709A